MRADEAMQREEERRAQAAANSYTPRKRIPWFRLDVGRSARIRFLWERRDGLGLYRHNRQVPAGSKLPRTVSCFRNVEYGEKDCPLCAEGIANRMEFFWLVYNYTADNADGTKGQVQLLNFRDTAYTPVKELRAMEENFGTIQDRDFIVQRVPAAPPRKDSQQSASRYMAIPDSPSGFAVKDLEVPTLEDVVEYLRPWEVRE